MARVYHCRRAAAEKSYLHGLDAFVCCDSWFIETQSNAARFATCYAEEGHRSSLAARFEESGIDEALEVEARVSRWLLTTERIAAGSKAG
ncbi:MAG: hypothetical protein WBF42_07010, partial [Terracidiphilus sp.]